MDEAERDSYEAHIDELEETVKSLQEQLEDAIGLLQEIKNLATP